MPRCTNIFLPRIEMTSKAAWFHDICVFHFCPLCVTLVVHWEVISRPSEAYNCRPHHFRSYGTVTSMHWPHPRRDVWDHQSRLLLRRMNISASEKPHLPLHWFQLRLRFALERYLTSVFTSLAFCMTSVLSWTWSTLVGDHQVYRYQ